MTDGFRSYIAVWTTSLIGGPSVFLHRDDAVRLRLTPTPDRPIAPPRGLARHPERVRFIQCDVCRSEGRDRWRRVDADTLAANCSRIRMLDVLDIVGEQIKLEQPQVLSLIHI